MLYKDKMTHYYEASHNFKIYRVVRLLYELKVIGMGTLLDHEDVMFRSKPVGVTLNLYMYSLVGPHGVIQF